MSRCCVPIPRCIYDYDLRHATKGRDFSYDGLLVDCKVVHVLDGDTVRIVFRYRGEMQQHICRMLGYDSPEMKPLLKNPNRLAEKAAAIQAKEALEEKLAGETLVKAECHGNDKYGRILVVLYKRTLLGGKGENINQYMLDNNFGVPYDGGTKTPFGRSN